MRSSKQRQRNKQNRNNRPSGGNIINRVFDSSGPEGKVRGTPAQIIEKYLQLHRDAQLAGDILVGQSAEEFQLDDPPLARIRRTEALERLVQVEDVQFRGADPFPDERQRHVLGAAATLVRYAIPRVIHEDAPHHHGRQSHELRAIRPVHFPLIEQPHIGLVNERRRLQRVSRPLATEVAGS